jgi:hypothetical protein
MPRLARIGVALVGLVVGLVALGTRARPANATVAQRMSLDDLLARSDLIVVGRAVRSASHYDDARSMILTNVDVLVERPVYGEISAGEHVTVELLGGTLDGLGSSVTGEATLSTGEEALLFLWNDGAYERVVGMAQGKLPIVADASGRSVVPDSTGLDLIAGPDGAGPDPALGPRPLDELIADITARLPPPPEDR